MANWLENEEFKKQEEEFKKQEIEQEKALIKNILQSLLKRLDGWIAICNRVNNVKPGALSGFKGLMINGNYLETSGSEVKSEKSWHEFGESGVVYTYNNRCF